MENPSGEFGDSAADGEGVSDHCELGKPPALRPRMTRAQIIDHILWLRTMDEAEARASLKRQHAWRPELDLINGVKEAIKGEVK